LYIFLDSVNNYDNNISDDILRKYIDNDSLFSCKYFSNINTDSIILITSELKNILRFTYPVSGQYYIPDFKIISKNDIDEILLMNVFKFWPGEIVLSELITKGDFWTVKDSELIYLDTKNGYEYYLYKKSDKEIPVNLMDNLNRMINTLNVIGFSTFLGVSTFIGDLYLYSKGFIG